MSILTYFSLKMNIIWYFDANGGEVKGTECHKTWSN
jgi:hypothetical protein